MSCRDKNCIAANHGKQMQNLSKSNECQLCGVHWNQASQMAAEDLAAARKRLLARQGQVRTAPIGATIEVTVEKEPDATWMSSDDEAEALTTALSLPPDYQAIANMLHCPREITEEFSAEAKLLKFKPAGKKAADVVLLQEELALEQSLLTLLELKKTTGDMAAT